MNTSLDSTTHSLPTRATPCTHWDLGTLISHVADSTELLIVSLGALPNRRTNRIAERGHENGPDNSCSPSDVHRATAPKPNSQR